MLSDETARTTHTLNEAEIARLAVLPEMEWRTSILRVVFNLCGRVDENTEITADTQEMVNRDVVVKVGEMYEIFDQARNGLRMIESIGKFGLKVGRAFVRVIEFLAKIAKPLFWIAAVTLGVVTWWKTGTFTLPEWTILK